MENPCVDVTWRPSLSECDAMLKAINELAPMGMGWTTMIEWATNEGLISPLEGSYVYDRLVWRLVSRGSNAHT